MNEPKEMYQIVAFFMQAKPDYFNAGDPGAAAIKFSTEQLGMRPQDLHPEHSGRFNGLGTLGWGFEVYVKQSAAQALLNRSHPNVLAIFD